MAAPAAAAQADVDANMAPDAPPAPTATQTRPVPQPPAGLNAATTQYIMEMVKYARDQTFDEIMSTIHDEFRPMVQEVTRLSAVPTQSPRSRLKVNPPPSFDGSRDKGEAFTQSVVLYLQLRESDFNSDKDRISWILTFLNEGRASTFRQSAIEYIDRHGSYKWPTLIDFTSEFVREFWPIAAEEEALATLEGRSYYQKASESVDSYVDRFRELVKRAELKDKAPIVIKFRRGLSSSIVSTLADSANPPSATDVEQWISRARLVERSRALQLNIQAAGKPALPPHRPTTQPLFQPQRAFAGIPAFTPRSVSSPAASAPPPFVPRRPPPPPLSKADQMEIDAQRAARHAQITCHRCGEVGHYANNCPTRYDIRFMSPEELEGAHAAALDWRELQEKQQLSEETPDRAQEDFGSPSG